jgi:malate dehydrogenase
MSSTVAILGAGPLGVAIAHRLAERARVREIVLIDSDANVAAGKALDIQQAGPIGGSDTRLSAMSDILAAAGASAIVVADDTATGEWDGDRGLAVVARLARAGTGAPFVFAGAKHVWLMEAAARELKVPGDRLVGTAASGVASAVAALTAIDAGRTAVDVTVCGRPPALVIAWSAATAGGSLVTDLVPAHRLLAISSALPRLWPPGPQTIAAPTAHVVEALIAGSRRRHLAMTMLDGELGARGVAAMLPLRLGHGRVLAREVPSLSPQERTELITGVLPR